MKTVNKIVAFLLTFGMLFSNVLGVMPSLALSIFAEENAVEVTELQEGEKTASEGLEFTSNGDGTCSVSGIGNCTDTDVIIPEVSPSGDTVTGVGVAAFAGCTELTSIAICQNIEGIGAYAFTGCYGLTSVDFKGNTKLESIGDFVFSGCMNLAGVDIPASVRYIGEGAFGYTWALGEISVAAENESYYVDGNCLIEIATKTITFGASNSVIPADGSVTSIGNYAFAGSEIFEISIPKNITSIGIGAFEDCTSLEAIYYAGTVSEWNDITKGDGWDSLAGEYTLHTKKETMRGDFDEDGNIDTSDAIYLLYHYFYQEDYPVNQSADINGDGYLNSNDALYLLYYYFYPDDYPLVY